jgi:hypothetical protein
MQKLELQGIISHFEERLLKAEGRLFAYEQLFKSLVIDRPNIPPEMIKTFVQGARDVLFKNLDGLDVSTTTYVRASIELMDHLLKDNTDEPAKRLMSSQVVNNLRNSCHSLPWALASA